MANYKTDLHIHTVLSPCAGLDMSPVNIIKKAVAEKIEILGVTDHNTTLHSKIMCELGKKNGIWVIPGVEVTTAEEVHCLAFFENIGITNQFQQYLDKHLPVIMNIPKKFGYQVVVDEHEQIIKQEERLLITAINQSIDEVANKVHSLNGVFIPAHINRPANGILHQLGFIPEGLQYNALEVSSNSTKQELFAIHSELRHSSITQSSDAHNLSQVGATPCYINMENLDWKAFTTALLNPLNINLQ